MFAIPPEVPARADGAVALPCALLGSAAATPAIATINMTATNAVAPRPPTLRPFDRRMTRPPCTGRRATPPLFNQHRPSDDPTHEPAACPRSRGRDETPKSR